MGSGLRTDRRSLPAFGQREGLSALSTAASQRSNAAWQDDDVLGRHHPATPRFDWAAATEKYLRAQLGLRSQPSVRKGNNAVRARRNPILCLPRNINVDDVDWPIGQRRSESGKRRSNGLEAWCERISDHGL